MNNIQRILIALSLISIILAVVLISGCVEEVKEQIKEVIQDPTAEVIDVDIIELSATEVTVDITVVVHNPNSFGGTFNRIEYTVYFKDERPLVGSDEYEFLGNSVDEKKVTIEKSDTTMYSFLTVRNRQILQSLTTLASQGQVWIKVVGTANLDLKATSYDIPFEKEILVML